MLSVIIPVYNSIKYLKKCVDSILAQTYLDFEILLIDDGSIDGSGILCDQYAIKDSRIKVVHQRNAGVSAARNAGLKIASGDYIVFVDADDFIDNQCFKRMYEEAIKGNADIVCCDCIKIVDGEKTDEFHTALTYRIINNREIFCADFIYVNSRECDQKEFYQSVVWGKLFRADLIKSLQFKSIQFGEDTVFMLELLKKNPKTILIPYVGYFYNQNDESVIRTAIKKNRDDIMAIDHVNTGAAFVELAENCEEKIWDFANEFYAHKIYSALSTVIKNGSRDLYFKNYDSMCIHIERVLGFTKLSVKMRVMLSLFKLNPKIYWKLVNIKQMVLGTK